ncbi:hypothetical protein VNO77_09987 [Canavalia gladiata]|uniref:Uncharacterized protein n=1 Tax=Canavalia gladiata TaxID=3824 RepID=A0AAN9M9V4_CANGL
MRLNSRVEKAKQRVLIMATTACFIIVSRNDIPIYEAEVGVAAKREDAAQLHQFILHAALDIVQDLAWTTSAMYLKSVDRFNELVVSVYVTAGHILYFFLDFIIHTRFMLLHDSRNDDGIKSFFQEVHELYIKKFAKFHSNCFVASLFQVPNGYCSVVEGFNYYVLLSEDIIGNTSTLLNPLYLPGSRITSSHFDTKVRALARNKGRFAGCLYCCVPQSFWLFGNEGDVLTKAVPLLLASIFAAFVDGGPNQSGDQLGDGLETGNWILYAVPSERMGLKKVELSMQKSKEDKERESLNACHLQKRVVMDFEEDEQRKKTHVKGMD